MSYPFQNHYYFDGSEVYQNVWENITGEVGTNPSDEILNIVDEIVENYKEINKSLGFDYDSNDKEVYKAYAREYLARTSATERNVYIVLGTIESGLSKGIITSPRLKITGRSSILDTAGNVVSDVFSGAGTIISNLGEGLVNTSGALKNLPVIIGAGAILYYFLMIAPKSKKG